jgi:hypothetical protein
VLFAALDDARASGCEPCDGLRIARVATLSRAPSLRAPRDRNRPLPAGRCPPARECVTLSGRLGRAEVRSRLQWRHDHDRRGRQRSPEAGRAQGSDNQGSTRRTPVALPSLASERSNRTILPMPAASARATRYASAKSKPPLTYRSSDRKIACSFSSKTD